MSSVSSRPASLAPVSGRLSAGLAFAQLNNGLWRVTRSNGSVLGYVEQPVTPGPGGAYVAKRLTADRRSFRRLGDFRSFDEALECLRFS
ncbi:MAG: hypothetical protein ABWZ77_07205 [Naasia sp.]